MNKEYYDPWGKSITKHGFHCDQVISALQKTIRRGQEDLAVRFGYELYITGEAWETKLWERILVISVEDIGFGEPFAPVFVNNLNQMRMQIPYPKRGMFFVHAIRYLCKCKKERSTENIRSIVEREFRRGVFPQIPEVALDMHTDIGQERGSDIFYFLEESSKVYPPAEGEEDYDKYRLQLIQMAREDEENEKKS